MTPTSEIENSQTLLADYAQRGRNVTTTKCDPRPRMIFQTWMTCYEVSGMDLRWYSS